MYLELVARWVEGVGADWGQGGDRDKHRHRHQSIAA